MLYSASKPLSIWTRSFNINTSERWLKKVDRDKLICCNNTSINFYHHSKYFVPFYIALQTFDIFSLKMNMHMEFSHLLKQ